MNSFAHASQGAKIAVMQKAGPDAIYGGVFPKPAIRSGSYLPGIRPMRYAETRVREFGTDVAAIKVFGFDPKEESAIWKAFHERPAAIAAGRKIGTGESVIFMMRETQPGEPGFFRAWGPCPGHAITSGTYLSSDKNDSMPSAGIAEYIRKAPPGAKVVIYGATPGEEAMFAAAGKGIYRATAACGAGIRINPIIPDI